jgi:triphosphoribosyl-dephospho-CoA synthetase
MVTTHPTPEFAGRSVRRNAAGVLVLAALLAVAFGCQGPAEAPKLTEAEGELVAELVQLHRLQVLQETRPAAADSLRGALQATLDGSSLDQRIRRLGEDPARGAVLLRAVRDSMAAMRRELFRTSAVSDDDAPQPRTPQVQPTAPAEGDREDED